MLFSGALVFWLINHRKPASLESVTTTKMWKCVQYWTIKTGFQWENWSISRQISVSEAPTRRFSSQVCCAVRMVLYTSWGVDEGPDCRWGDVWGEKQVRGMSWLWGRICERIGKPKKCGKLVSHSTETLKDTMSHNYAHKCANNSNGFRI